MKSTQAANKADKNVRIAVSLVRFNLAVYIAIGSA